MRRYINLSGLLVLAALSIGTVAESEQQSEIDEVVARAMSITKSSRQTHGQFSPVAMEQLRATATRLLELAESDKALWAVVNSSLNQNKVEPPARVCQIIGPLLEATYRACDEDADKLKWLLERERFALRVLHSNQLQEGLRRMWSREEESADPFGSEEKFLSHNLSTEAGRALSLSSAEFKAKFKTPGRKADIDFTSLVSSLKSDLVSARLARYRLKKMNMDDWGVLAGTYWFSGLDFVQRRGSEVYVSVNVFDRLSIRYKTAQTWIEVNNGLRSARVGLGYSDSKLGFQDQRGVVWVSLRVLEQMKLYEVEYDPLRSDGQYARITGHFLAGK